MYRTPRTLALVLTILLGLSNLHAGSSWAADVEGKFAVRGIGAERCEALAKLVTGDNALHVQSWLMGYLSAHNRLSKKTFDAIPTSSGVDFLKAVGIVCTNNLEMRIEAAASEALAVLSRVRLTRETERVLLKHEGRSAAIRKESMRALAENLIALGHLDRSWAGEASSDLFEAVENFQLEEGLEVTGLPNIDTLFRASARANRN